MKKRFTTIVFLMSVTLINSLLFYCAMENQNMYTIADGNGNLYIITTKTVEYKPISPAMSSSGLYSGGEYRKLEITTTQYNQIKTKIDSVLANKSMYINNRIKGSGLITIIGENEKKETYLIKPASLEFMDLEDILRNIIE